MPTHFHTHTGVPCNPPTPGPSCAEGGTVVSCDKGTGLLGPVWICVHEDPAPPVTPAPAPGSAPTPVTPGSGPGPAPGPVVPPPAPPKIRHHCETVDAAVEHGFVFDNAIDKDATVAAKKAGEGAAARGRRAGEDASKKHECSPPCRKFDRVRVELWNPSIQAIGTGADKVFSVTVIATWYLDILCVLAPEPDKGKDKGGKSKDKNKPAGSGGGGKKKAKKPPGKGKTKSKPAKRRG